MRKIAIMCSGGMKSSWLCELAAKETSYAHGRLLLIFFDHKQQNLDAERKSVRALSAKYHASLLEIPFVFNTHYSPELAIGAWPIFKFTSMLYLGLSISSDQGYDLFYCGFSKDEIEPKYEHGLDYIRTLQGTLSIIQPKYDADGFMLPQIEVETPLAYLDLKRVVRLGEEWKVEWTKTWSCEMPQHTFQCGMCRKCLQRQKAFKDAGVDDPTVYQLVLENKSSVSYTSD